MRAPQTVAAEAYLFKLRGPVCTLGANRKDVHLCVVFHACHGPSTRASTETEEFVVGQAGHVAIESCL